MGDEATPEDTSGVEPTPPDAQAEAVAPETPALPGDAPTQEIPAVQGDLLEDADSGAEVSPETEVAAEEAPAEDASAGEAPAEAESSAPAEEQAETQVLTEEQAETQEPEETAAETQEPAEPAEAPPAAPAATEPAEPAEPPVDGEQPAAEAAEVVPVAAAVAAAAEPPASPDGPAHAAKRPSIWRSILTVIAVLAIVAGGALAGYAYGRSTAPGPDIVVQGEPAIEQPPEAEAMPSTVAPLLSVRVQAVGAPTAVLSAAAGLDDTSGSATGYRVVNSGISGGQIASVLAKTFGIKGATIQQDGTWTVGKDGGPVLVVEDDPLFSWSYRDAEKLANPSVGQQLEPADAIELAQTLLAGIGVDTSAVDWQVARYFDRTAVTAWQLVADQRTELRWLLAFDPDGAVVEAAGFSASVEPAGTYSVVGAATAVNRSTTAPWWTLGPTQVAPGDELPTEEPTVGEQPVDEQASAAEPTAVSSVEPSADAAPSDAGASSEPTFAPEPSAEADTTQPPAAATSAATDAAAADTQPGLVIPVDQVVATEAELGLAQYWQPDGGVLMLPSYILTGLDGSRWSLIAVTDEYVDFTPTTAPQ